MSTGSKMLGLCHYANLAQVWAAASSSEAWDVLASLEKDDDDNDDDDDDDDDHGTEE